VVAKFSVPAQNGPGAHPASYSKGNGPLPGLKWLGHGTDHQPQSSTKVKEREELYLYLNFYFPLIVSNNFPTFHKQRFQTTIF